MEKNTIAVAENDTPIPGQVAVESKNQDDIPDVATIAENQMAAENVAKETATVSELKKISPFSLAGIRAKKELQEQHKSVVISSIDQPSDIFDAKQVNFYWKQYADTLGQRGLKDRKSVV